MKRIVKISMIQIFIASVITIIFVTLTKEKVEQERTVRLIRKAIMENRPNEERPKTPEEIENEYKQGEEKLATLKKLYPTPEKLFEALKENFKFSTYLMDQEKSGSFSAISSELSMGKESLKLHYPRVMFTNNNHFKINLKDKKEELMICRFNTVLEQKKFIPIEGSYKAQFFCRKISSDPDFTAINSDYSFTFRDRFDYFDKKKYIQAWSDPAKKCNGCIEKLVARKRISYSDVGTYAIQCHFYPNKEMAKSMEGILKSPIYYIHVEDK